MVINYKIYLERIAFYKKLGFDQEQARNNIISFMNPNIESILEIGTGKGYLSIKLAEVYNHLVSIDLDQENQKIAMLLAKKFNLDKKINFILGNAEKLEFEDKNFDAVISAFTFHHFKNPFRVIDEMIRVTRKTLLISDFNQRGFEIINKAHEMEGRKHDRERGDFSIVGIYLREHGFQVAEHEDQWQKIYKAKKKIGGD